MRLLAEMVSDPSSSSEREKNFGSDEADWLVYRQVALREEREKEEDGEEELLKARQERLEAKLRLADPQWAAAEQRRLAEEQRRERRRERRRKQAEREASRLPLLVERIRGPELLFQPQMVGLDETGLCETVQRLLSRLEGDDPQLAERLAANILLTGGGASLPGLRDRILSDLRALRPPGALLRVSVAAESSLGAWKGMRAAAKLYAKQPQLFYLSRREYEEKGADYLREHRFSNLFHPVPPEPEPSRKRAK